MSIKITKISIYVATFTSSSGYPYQKVFKIRKQANDWLYKKWYENIGYYLASESNHKEEFKEWCGYGSFNGKVKKFTLTI
jgi:hypothetical protein